MRVVLLRRRRPTSSALTLTSVLFVELPGIETACLPGNLPSERQFRSVSFRFVPVQSRSLPAVLFSGLDGVKSGRGQL